MDQDKAQGIISEWLSMYGVLQELSSLQAEMVKTGQEDETWGSQMASLGARWQEQQSLIMSHEDKLKRLLPAEAFKEIHKEHIQPLLQEIQRNVDAAANELEKSMHTVGASVQRSANFRIASNLYHTAGMGEDIAIFFDEKK